MALPGRLGFLVVCVIAGVFTVAVPELPQQEAVGAGAYDQDSGVVVRYGEWKVAMSDHDHGGSTGYTSDENASASLTFSGSAIRWLSRVSPTSGMATVYLDGIEVATVDLYSPETRFRQVVFERSQLTEGRHVIRIVRTGQSNVRAVGSNIVLDALVVPDTVPPSAPTDLSVSTDRSGLRLRWNTPPDEDVLGYRVFRRQTSLGRWVKISGAEPLHDNELTDVALASGVPYHYAVQTVDQERNSSELSRIVTGTGPSFDPVTEYRYDNCPAPTISVSHNQELEEALDQAGPGDVIRLEDGIYDPFDVADVSGEPDDPVWICGSPRAVIDRANPWIASGIYVDNSENVVVAGLSVQRSRKGVVVDRSENVVIADLHVSDIGEEGIHLRRNTSDSWVVGNTVEGTGLVNEGYGEGIYIGSSTTNWCDINNCQADEANGNYVVDNVLRDITAEGIEAKEGTWGGTISGNTIDGAGMTSDSGGFVMVKGNEWLVMDNHGTGAPGDGMRIIPTGDDLGLHNQFVDNHLTLSGEGFGIYADYIGDETVVACDNAVNNSGKGMTNVVCQP